MCEYSQETLDAAAAIYAMQHHKMNDNTQESKATEDRKALKARRDALEEKLELADIESGRLYLFEHNLTKTDVRYQSEERREMARKNKNRGEFNKRYM